MGSVVYVETSVPSAYVSGRTDPGSVHRRAVTREWWRDQLARYDATVSDAVILELSQGDWSGKDEALRLIEALPRLVVDAEIIAVASRYIEERLVPAGLGGDAVHLAAACVHGVDFLLTWNIRHLANPNKLHHLTAINRRMGLLTPQIVTPEMLWTEDES
jgi:predicted nucleic acid-binding protein